MFSKHRRERDAVSFILKTSQERKLRNRDGLVEGGALSGRNTVGARSHISNLKE